MIKNLWTIKLIVCFMAAEQRLCEYQRKSNESKVVHRDFVVHRLNTVIIPIQMRSSRVTNKVKVKRVLILSPSACNKIINRIVMTKFSFFRPLSICV